MASRLKLQEQLEELLGNNNVYFQPPESLKLAFPCIIYELQGIDTEKADDTTYIKTRHYKVTLVHSDPDNDMIDKILTLPYCEMRQPYTSGQHYHYVFDLFY